MEYELCFVSEILSINYLLIIDERLLTLTITIPCVYQKIKFICVYFDSFDLTLLIKETTDRNIRMLNQENASCLPFKCERDIIQINGPSQKSTSVRFPPSLMLKLVLPLTNQ